MTHKPARRIRARSLGLMPCTADVISRCLDQTASRSLAAQTVIDFRMDDIIIALFVLEKINFPDGLSFFILYPDLIGTILLIHDTSPLVHSISDTQILVCWFCNVSL